MKRTEFLTALEQYKNELARQDEKKSTGSRGKLAEVLLRDYILKKGIKTVSDIRARKAEKVDVMRKAYGKIEIKTGSGAVAYGVNFTTEDLTEENVCADADLICWTPFNSFWTEETLYSMTWVFTREQFIDTLETIGKNGLRSSLKVSKQGAQINIQTITPRMEDRLWDILDNMPTVEQFFRE